MTATPVQAFWPIMVRKCDRELTYCVYLLLDLLPLEQDAVFGLESLLVLCSQDDSPGAQATLKVTVLLSFPSTALSYNNSLYNRKASVYQILSGGSIKYWKETKIFVWPITGVQSSRETEHNYSATPLSSRVSQLL